MTNRAENVPDVVAVETVAPGLVKVVSWSDAYHVDVRGDGCNCKDQQYNLAPDEECKHHHAAMLAMSDRYPSPCIVSDNLRGTQEATL
jgi:hypothetical protein